MWTAEAVEFTVELENGILESDNGVLNLTWADGEDSEEHPTFELQQAPDETFSGAETRYRGGETSSYLTGFAEGDYFFRVRAGEGPWTAPLRAEVRFIDRRVLWALLLTGFAVAAATVGVILKGAVSTRK